MALSQIGQFAHALRVAGLPTTDAICADGKLHRFHVEGDKLGSRNGWYWLAESGLLGGYGCWKRGTSQKWRANVARSLTASELKRQRAQVAEMRRLREQEGDAIRLKCRRRAAFICDHAPPASPTHPYLVKKGVGVHGIAQWRGLLVVQVADTEHVLHGLQFIDEKGRKNFQRGTQKCGSYHAIGPAPRSVLCVAEGYATAATVHEATGWPVAVAFDAGNLKPVTLALRQKLPDVRIIIAADNDTATPGNPGLTKARAAAAAVGGIVIAPRFNGRSPATDWNDYAQAYGLAPARSALLQASKVRRGS